MGTGRRRRHRRRPAASCTRAAAGRSRDPRDRRRRGAGGDQGHVAPSQPSEAPPARYWVSDHHTGKKELSMAIVPPEQKTHIDDVLAEFRSWLDQNWDPDLTVAEWWERLGLAGWSAPTLPENAYGHGLSRSDSAKVMAELTKHGALGPPGGLGLLLAAPTIATHGSQEQIDLYVRDIVTGQKAWCQLFSEPGAGSDLAGLTTKAVKDGDVWVINGQKVWTSAGQVADMGMLIARSNVDVPKHQGITWFAFDMHQP